LIENPRLKPSFSLEVLPDKSVLLVSEFKSVVISNPIAQSLLIDIAQQKLSLQAIIAKFTDNGVPPFQVMRVLFELNTKGYIMNNDSTLDDAQMIYWENHEFDVKIIERLLREKALSVKNLSNIETTLFENACQEAGLQITDKGDLVVIMVDNYSDYRLREINTEFERSKKPWMLIKITGSDVWLGPLFVPGKTACWNCLKQRLDLNKPIDVFYQNIKNTSKNLQIPIANLSITNQIGANMAVMEIIKWFYNDQKSKLEENILRFDPKTLEHKHHRVFKRPQCKICGDELKRTIQKPITLSKQSSEIATRLGGYRSVPPEVTFAKYKDHISNICGVIPNLRPYGRIENTPVFNYSSGRNLGIQSKSLFWLDQHLMNGNGGKGKTEIQAKTGAICEAIERYSLMYQGDVYGIEASMAELEGAIHPNSCMNYSDKQFANREKTNREIGTFNILVPEPFEMNAKMEWTPVYSLLEQKFKYLPSCFCYGQYPVEDGDKVYAFPDPNGCAAGNTIEEAILQGFLELVERDAAAIWWYNRLKRPAVDLRSLNNPYLEKVISYYHSIGRNLWVLDITTDLGIPAFVAITSEKINKETKEQAEEKLEKKEGKKQKILYAFGAHVDAKIAIERSVIEVNQLLPIIQGEQYLTEDKIFLDWLDNKTLNDQRYLVPSEEPAKTINDYPPLCEANIYESVKFCVDTVHNHGLETLILDMTQPDIGLPVVKVIVPGLRHYWRRTAAGRLYDVPVKMGWLAEALTEDTLNPIGIFI